MIFVMYFTNFGYLLIKSEEIICDDAPKCFIPDPNKRVIKVEKSIKAAFLIEKLKKSLRRK